MTSSPPFRIAILGFGREGQSILKFIRHRPEYRGAEIWILDKNKSLQIPKGLHTALGPNYLSSLKKIDLVFRSPGIPWNLPALRAARKNGVEFSSLTKLFFEHCPARIVGVTGTKGKGTTSTLIHDILKAAGKKVFLAGNIGTPALDLLHRLDKNSWIVLELSSFQLIDLKKSPHIAVALMVTQEHLDWHASIKEYVSAKANIVRFQSNEDMAVLAADYPKTISYARMTKADVFTFSRRKAVKRGTSVKNGYFVFRKNGSRSEKVCPVTALQIPGEHNWENAAAAITVGKVLGISNATVQNAIRNFKGLEHRLEFVRTINGVRYYDDSYATTPETAIVAIQSFPGPKILILGGSPKGSNFATLGKVISRSHSIRAIVGIGAEWPRIKRSIRNKTIPLIEGCKNMKEVIRAVHAIAYPGDVVLLSPACASFGMFKNYSERGKQFKECVLRLKSNPL